MPTWTALTALPDKAAAETLGEALEGMTPEPVGVGVFELEDGSGLWGRSAPISPMRPTTSPCRCFAAALLGARPFAVSELPETDWVAHVRRELHPVEAGRFYLHGAHDAESVPPGPRAASDRGGHGLPAPAITGRTKGCLEAYDRLLAAGFVPQRGPRRYRRGHRGFWPSRRPRPHRTLSIASDIDPVAVEVSEANARANDVAAKLRCIEAEGFDHPDLAAGAPYDLIFAEHPSRGRSSRLPPRHAGPYMADGGLPRSCRGS